MTSKHQPIAKPNYGSGWTNNFELWFLISTLYFQSAAVGLGGRTEFYFPTCIKPCPLLAILYDHSNKNNQLNI
jgi:hypothetical protein